MHLKQRPIIFFLREQVPSEVLGVCKRAPGRPPVSVVAICEDTEGNTARGIAILSEADNFCRSIGRRVAIEKARWALKNKKSGFPIGWSIVTDTGAIVRPAALRFMSAWFDKMHTESAPGYKATFNPALTFFEQHLVEKDKEHLVLDVDPAS